MANRWRLPRLVPFALFLSLAGLASYFAWLLATQKKPDSTGVGLLVIASASLLAMALWGGDLIRRVRKVGTAGVELDVWQDIGRIPQLQDVPEPPPFDQWGEDATPLDARQRWFYELSSNLLFHLRHLGVKAEELKGEQLLRYRNLVVWVAKAALSNLDYYKAAETLKQIEHVADLSGEELYRVADGYFRVAWHEASQGISDERYHHLLRHCEELLRRALAKHPDHAAAHFTIAYIFDELGEYSKAILHNQSAIDSDFDPSYGAYWNMAVSYVKTERHAEALQVLGKIQRGAAWNELCADPELSPLKENPEFTKLCYERSVREE